jgi:hypothetical protein
LFLCTQKIRTDEVAVSTVYQSFSLSYFIYFINLS